MKDLNVIINKYIIVLIHCLTILTKNSLNLKLAASDVFHVYTIK